MTRFRPFLNDDPPALADLWNRGRPAHATARPLSGHDIDTFIVNKPYFEAEGLIVAERDGRPVGFAHAGFGPEHPAGPPHHLSRELGTLGMLVTEPGPEDPGLEQGLLIEAERYLRRRGASVLYAGGQYPLNPFYWGLYGGSEWSGILAEHEAFLRAVRRAGYEPVSTTVLLEADLSVPEVRDPKSFLIRRHARVEVIEDALPSHWWEALAVGDFRPTGYRLLTKEQGRELARATTWDMSRFGTAEGRTRLGLINVEVHPEHRRQGYGRHLVGEILRQARAEMVALVDVQTGALNRPALALYESLGFARLQTAIFHRLPAGNTGRSL